MHTLSHPIPATQAPTLRGTMHYNRYLTLGHTAAGGVEAVIRRNHAGAVANPEPAHLLRRTDSRAGK
jgi:hypothetical protein